MITRTSDHIKVEGRTGTWYVIDEGVFELTPDTPCIILTPLLSVNLK